MRISLHRTLVAAALLTAPFWAAAQVESVGADATAHANLPEVVAAVDGEPITRDVFVQALNMAKRRLLANPQAQQQGMTDLNNQQKRMVLESIINTKIVVALATKAGIVIEDAEVEEFVERERVRFPSAEVFENFLRSEGITEEQLRLQTREMLKAQAYGKQLTADVTVTEEEVRELYENLRDEGRMNAPKTWDFRHILIKANPEDAEARAAAEAEAKAVRARIAGGEDFGAVAEEVSDDLNSRDEGGFYRNVPKGRGMFDEEFEEAALSVAEGELSEPFSTRMGWHLIQMEKVYEAGLMAYERVQGSLETQALAMMGQAAIRRHVEEARADIRVEVFVNLDENSESPSAIDEVLRQLDSAS